MAGHASQTGVERDDPWATGFWDAVGYNLDAGMARYVRNL